MSTTCFHNSLVQLALEALPDYPDVRERFLAGFENFVSIKKREAVSRVLPQEVANETVVKCPDFQAAVIRHLDSEALLEKPFIFLSFNSKTLL